MVQPDPASLLAEAYANPVRVPLERARELLGDLLDEDELSDETMVVRAGVPVALTAATWIRMLRKALARRGRDGGPVRRSTPEHDAQRPPSAQPSPATHPAAPPG